MGGQINGVRGSKGGWSKKGGTHHERRKRKSTNRGCAGRQKTGQENTITWWGVPAQTEKLAKLGLKSNEQNQKTTGLSQAVGKRG